MSASFDAQCTALLNTYRSPDLSADKRRGAHVLYLSAIACTPLYPLSGELALQATTSAPYKALETFCRGEHDIKNGDEVQIDERRYPVQAVEPWPWSPGETVYRITVRDPRQ